MPTLPLAMDIAETVSDAIQSHSPVDADAKAEELLRGHPEAEATWSEVADTLREESEAARRPESQA